MKPLRSSHRRAAGAGILVIAVVGVVAATAALALARSATLTAARVRLHGRTARVVVNGRGVTVYWLSGESARHLLCTSSACFAAWPPVRAVGRPTAAGFRGRLGTLRRHGFTQVTLNGRPVYTYIGDGGRRGVASGDGIFACGGTWHVFPG